jgi:hypothetical protein
MSSENKIEKPSSETEYKALKVNSPNPKAKKPQSLEKPNWFKRKYIKIKGAANEFWVVGKYGFQLGGMAGIILGFFVGGFESIRMKSIWPMPLAMLGSGFTFGCIFAISTVLRSDDNNNNSNNELGVKNNYEIVYYDQKQGKYIKMMMMPNVKENLDYMEKFNSRL